jgi:hypothetical protein
MYLSIGGSYIDRGQKTVPLKRRFIHRLRAEQNTSLTEVHTQTADRTRYLSNRGSYKDRGRNTLPI